MARARSSRLKLWLVLLVLLVLVLAGTGPFFWMPALGAALVRDDGPAKADMVVVLGGDQRGSRILRAAELVKQGYAPTVLVSGPEFYDIHESDAAIDFAVHRGSPREWFIGVPISALSTREESEDLLDALKRRAVHSFILVTNNYHTGRAARIFRAAIRKRGDQIEMRVVGAPDKYFSPNGWWTSREGLKIFFMEWSKTIATAVGV